MTEQNTKDSADKVYAYPPEPEDGDAEQVTDRQDGESSGHAAEAQAATNAASPSDHSLDEADEARGDGNAEVDAGEEQGHDDGTSPSTLAVLASACGLLPQFGTSKREESYTDATRAADAGRGDDAAGSDDLDEGDGALDEGASEDAEAAEVEGGGARRAAGRAALPAAILPNTVLVYDRDELRRAIRELRGRAEQDTDYFGPENEAPDTSLDLSSEDRHRLRQLRRIANARLGPRRRLIVGTATMLAKLEAIAADCPHFAPLHRPGLARGQPVAHNRHAPAAAADPAARRAGRGQDTR